MKKLFGTRVQVFHNWIHSPRNWYWDDVRKGFTVFAFTPDLVHVNREGNNSRLVQQLVEYHVEKIYDADFYKALLAYLRDRKSVSTHWMDLQGMTKNKMTKELRAKINEESNRDMGYNESTRREVKAWSSELMKSMTGMKHWT